MKRIIIIIILVIAVLGGGSFAYYQYTSAQAAQNVKYQTQVLATGPLISIIGATGTVRSNQTTHVTWQTSGRVSKIDVIEGQTVHKGDILAELDPESLPQSIIMAQADLVDARKSLDDLTNSETAKAKAALALANAQKTLDDAQKTRKSKDYNRASDASIEQARSNYELAVNSYKTAKESYDALAGMADDNPTKAAALSSLASAQLMRDKTLTNLNWLLGKPDTVEVAQADGNVDVAKAQLADAQREWDRLKNGVDPNDLVAAQAKVNSIEATLSYTKLTAPFDGTVTVVNSMVGDQVSAGSDSFQIDDLSSLEVDVQVPEVDINKVKVGQPAQLTFDAIPNKTYNGKVEQCSNIGVSVSGVVDYTVTVTLTNNDADVLTGMTASVNIIVKQLDNVLLVPNRAVKRVNGKTYIYLLKNKVPVQTEIQLGAYSDTTSEIAGGEVKVGDILVLNPPAATAQPPAGPASGGAN